MKFLLKKILVKYFYQELILLCGNIFNYKKKTSSNLPKNTTMIFKKEYFGEKTSSFKLGNINLKIKTFEMTFK